MMTKRYVLPGLLALSVAGAGLVIDREGIPTQHRQGQPVAVAYADPAHGWAVPTICAGRTTGVFRGQVATLQECQAWLIEDATDAGRAVARCAPVPMTQSQYDTLVSYVINIGGAAFCGSRVSARLRAGDCPGAAHEMHSAPQIDRATGRPRIWAGPSIIDRSTGRTLLRQGDTVKKWTTAGGKPLPGLIKRRHDEAARLAADCRPQDMGS